MAAALETLADLVGNPAIAERNAMSPLSFSMVSSDVETSQCNILKTFHRGQNTAFSPLGPDGRPVRKYVTLALHIYITSILMTRHLVAT